MLHVDPQVEGTVRAEIPDAALVEQVARRLEVAPVVLSGVGDVLVVARYRRDRGELGRGVNATDHGLLHRAHGRSETGRGDEVADPHSCHRVGLREGEDREDAVVLVEARDARVPDAVGEVLVHLVAQHPEVVAAGEVEQLAQSGLVEHGAEGVRGRIDDEHAGATRHEALELLDTRREPVLGFQRVRHGNRGEHARAHRERGVPGIGHEDLVARIEQEAHGLVQRLGRADRDPHLFELDVKAVLARELLDDRRAQLGNAGVGRVVRDVVGPALRAGGEDVRRDREVGLADAEGDHVIEFDRDLEDAADPGCRHRGDVRCERRHTATLSRCGGGQACAGSACCAGSA